MPKIESRRLCVVARKSNLFAFIAAGNVVDCEKHMENLISVYSFHVNHYPTVISISCL